MYLSSCRCNTTKQLVQYAHFHQKFWQINDNEIFERTGCLSKCNKYAYKAEPVDSFTTRDTDARFNNTLGLVLWFPTNEYESRKQVIEVLFSIAGKSICVIFSSPQYIIYDGNAFLADVGGYLGLLLGQSLFGIYDIIATGLRSKKALGCRSRV